MTRGAALQIRKETRALLPAWTACASALVLVALVGDSRFYLPALLAYGLGSIALGALSVGHEYSGRTLGLLLSFPLDRRRLFLLKLTVLSVLLLGLAGVAWAALMNPRTFYVGFGHSRQAAAGLTTSMVVRPVEAFFMSGMNAFIVVPPLAAFFMAPALTMASRSPLGGIVFTITTIAVVWGAGFPSPLFPHGLAPAGASDPTAFRLAFFWQGVTALCALGAFASWWQFTRLEAIEGRGQEVHLPFWTRASGEAAAAPHSVFWEVVKKELRIQQLTMVVGGIYGVGWFAIGLVGRYFPDSIDLPPGALTLLYGPLLGLLAGSLASAEERQLGTLEWQLLLPMAAWKQWFAKVGVALALALLLGLGLPVLVVWISPSILGVRLDASLVALVVLLTTVALYVSSFSASGVRALLVSLPVVFGLTLFARLVIGPFLGAMLADPSRMLGAAVLSSSRPVTRSFTRLLPAMTTVLVAAGFVAAALGAGLANHRSAERGARRLWKQGFWILGGVFVGAAVLALCVTVVAGRIG